MDKVNWYESREKLVKLLESKHKELQQCKNDIEEIEFCIETYSQKVGDYKPEENKQSAETAINA